MRWTWCFLQDKKCNLATFLSVEKRLPLPSSSWSWSVVSLGQRRLQVKEPFLLIFIYRSATFLGVEHASLWTVSMWSLSNIIQHDLDNPTSKMAFFYLHTIFLVQGLYTLHTLYREDSFISVFSRRVEYGRMFCGLNDWRSSFQSCVALQFLRPQRNILTSRRHHRDEDLFCRAFQYSGFFIRFI